MHQMLSVFKTLQIVMQQISISVTVQQQELTLNVLHQHQTALQDSSVMVQHQEQMLPVSIQSLIVSLISSMMELEIVFQTLLIVPQQADILVMVPPQEVIQDVF